MQQACSRDFSFSSCFDPRAATLVLSDTHADIPDPLHTIKQDLSQRTCSLRTTLALLRLSPVPPLPANYAERRGLGGAVAQSLQKCLQVQ